MNKLKVEEFEKFFYEIGNLKEKFNFYWQNKVILETKAPLKNVRYIDFLLKAAIEQQDKEIEHLIYIFQGYSYKKDGYYDKALQLYYKSKDYFYQTDNKLSYAKIVSDISVIFALLGLNNQACYLWKDLIRNYIDKNNFYQKGIMLNNLITTSISSYQNFDQIELILEELLEEIKNANYNDPYYYNFIYCKSMINLGYFYHLKYKDYKKSLTYYDKALSVVNEIHDNDSKYDIYVKIADSYKGLKDDSNRIHFLLKAYETIDNSEENINCLYLFNELYLYYKSKEDLKKALFYYEIINKLELLRKEQENNINAILEKIGIESNDIIHNKFLKEYSKIHIFDFNRDLFLENIKGDLVKISLDEIISVESYSKMIKIKFVNKSNHIYKPSLKDFSELLKEKFGNDHLFFSTNLRSEMVNLFWMSKYDKTNKTLYFNVIGQEIEFQVTRSQAILLKELLKNNI